jgi:hypothetical protein
MAILRGCLGYGGAVVSPGQFRFPTQNLMLFSASEPQRTDHASNQATRRQNTW